jgi:hypothetical protein
MEEVIFMSSQTSRPREIMMPAGNPKTQPFYESLGIKYRTVDVSELRKASVQEPENPFLSLVEKNRFHACN